MSNMSNAKAMFDHYLKRLRKIAEEKNIPLIEILRPLINNPKKNRLAELAEMPEQTESRLIELERLEFYELVIDDFMNTMNTIESDIEQRAANRVNIKFSQAAKHAADMRHSAPGASREKHKNICEIWASGKYTSRDICAEQEYEGLGFGSLKTARTALINTPDPDPWPAKKAKVK